MSMLPGVRVWGSGFRVYPSSSILQQGTRTAWLPPRMSMLPSGKVITVGYQRREDMVATCAADKRDLGQAATCTGQP